MVVLDVLANEKAQVAFAEHDHPAQTFLFDRPDEPFRVCVQVRTSRRELDRRDTAVLQDLVEPLGEQRVPVVNQMFRALQEATERIGKIACHLLHHSP